MQFRWQLWVVSWYLPDREYRAESFQIGKSLCDWIGVEQCMDWDCILLSVDVELKYLFIARTKERFTWQMIHLTSSPCWSFARRYEFCDIYSDQEPNKGQNDIYRTSLCYQNLLSHSTEKLKTMQLKTIVKNNKLESMLQWLPVWKSPLKTLITVPVKLVPFKNILSIIFSMVWLFVQGLVSSQSAFVYVKMGWKWAQDN